MTQVLYYALQGTVILGLIVRYIIYLTFQKRLSIFGGILVCSWVCASKNVERRTIISPMHAQVQVLPEIAHLLVVIVVVVAPLAIMLILQFGHRCVMVLHALSVMHAQWPFC